MPLGKKLVHGIVGYCHYHKRNVSFEFMRERECNHKNSGWKCRYFSRRKEHPYWTYKYNAKRGKRIKKLVKDMRGVDFVDMAKEAGKDYPTKKQIKEMAARVYSMSGEPAEYLITHPETAAAIPMINGKYAGVAVIATEKAEQDVCYLSNRIEATKILGYDPEQVRETGGES